MTRATTGIAIAAAASGATAGSLFTWSGTASGTYQSTTITDASFSFSIFVEDVSADLSTPLDFGSFAIRSITMSVDDGAYTETLGAFNTEWSSVFVDPGDAGDDQLVAASNLFGSLGGGASFTVGALLGTSDAFSDPDNLSGASSFTVAGLSGVNGSYVSGLFDLDLAIDGFTYNNNAVNPIPLPHPAMMAGIGLAGVGFVRRRRA